MKHTERQPFDDAWREALTGAESTPSERVWTAVEGALNAAENQRNKRRAVFYQRLAAAMLLFSVASGIIAYENWPTEDVLVQNPINREDGGGLPSETSILPPAGAPATPADSSPEAGAGRGREDVAGANASPENQQRHRGQKAADGPSKFVRKPSHRTRSGALAAGDVPQQAGRATPYTADGSQPDFQSGVLIAQTDEGRQALHADSATHITQSLTPEEEKALVRKLLGESEPAEQPERKKKQRGTWAALGASGGSYAPGALPNQTAVMSTMLRPTGASSPDPANERASTGTSYSLGLSLGTVMGSRWRLQAGIAYVNQQIDYTSNVTAIGPSNTPLAFASDAASLTNVASLQVTTPYVINSISEFVSVPVQLGYQCVDKRIGVIISTGVATDFFARNTLVDRSGRADTFRQSAGSESAFRSVTWSGLGNVEVSYQLAERYSLALVPGVRYALSNVSRADDNFYRPVVLDVGFRLRYQL
ncbi:MAG: hypothetical protein MUC38_05420 [Cyclobacteriaceae bacterium]|nr:hypothetical protein [Cyclobacteriaceae bacterium]